MASTTTNNSLFQTVYGWTDPFLPESLDWLVFLIAGSSIALFIVNSLMILTMIYIYMERRLIGRFQSRIGPNRVGPFGLFQPLADGIKILTKEDIVPSGADRWVFNLAPVVMFSPVLLALAVIPFGENAFLADINVGLLYFIALSTITTLAMFMAGWASGNRYALFGSMRAVAQLISYEIPVVLSVVGILIMVGSLSLVKIVDEQRIPFILLQPMGFLIFLIGASAELNRTPFDLMEAESEIVAGFHTEYSGMKFGMFYMAEFSGVLVTSAVMATLFLKGWEGPFLPSPVWFLIKVFFLAYIMIWIRATLPRLRIDQVLSFAWKILFPLSLINIFATAVEVWLWPDPTTVQLWAMVTINMLVAAVSFIAVSNIGKRQDYTKKNVAKSTTQSAMEAK
jgi:NADH-quinone oxidoreductase subunit H